MSSSPQGLENAEPARPDSADAPRRARARIDAHVLIVDDDERIRSLLKRYLVKNGYAVTEARDAQHARRLLGSLDFDILIVDVMMPGEDGVSLTTGVGRRTPVLLLTAKDETEDRIKGLEAGADDYLTKPFEPRELLLRLDAILRRAHAPPPRTKGLVVALGDAHFDVERGELKRGDQEVRLTTAEIALMRMLARRMNEPVSRSDLLAELGPNDSDDPEGGKDRVQDRAIDVQITRLRKKLEPSTKTPRYIKTVRGAGYMLTPDGAL